MGNQAETIAMSGNKMFRLNKMDNDATKYIGGETGVDVIERYSPSTGHVLAAAADGAFEDIEKSKENDGKHKR